MGTMFVCSLGTTFVCSLGSSFAALAALTLAAMSDLKSFSDGIFAFSLASRSLALRASFSRLSRASSAAATAAAPFSASVVHTTRSRPPPEPVRLASVTLDWRSTSWPKECSMAHDAARSAMGSAIVGV